MDPSFFISEMVLPRKCILHVYLFCFVSKKATFCIILNIIYNTFNVRVTEALICIMVNNISVISRRSVALVEETGVPAEIHRYV